jgi:hypothetical protein
MRVDRKIGLPREIDSGLDKSMVPGLFERRPVNLPNISLLVSE